MAALPGSVPATNAITWPDDIFGKRTTSRRNIATSCRRKQDLRVLRGITASQER
jgi:hypothetical protein